jgi:hypothetical protein
MDFGSMMGFIGLFDTIRDYTVQFTAYARTLTHTSVHSHIFTSRYLVAASTADVPLSLSSLTDYGLSYQILTATEQNN